VIYVEKLLAEDFKSVISKDVFRPVIIKVGESDLEEVDPSSGGSSGEEMMMMM
jgi:hypothetical protein